MPIFRTTNPRPEMAQRQQSVCPNVRGEEKEGKTSGEALENRNTVRDSWSPSGPARIWHMEDEASVRNMGAINRRPESEAQRLHAEHKKLSDL